MVYCLNIACPRLLALYQGHLDIHLGPSEFNSSSTPNNHPFHRGNTSVSPGSETGVPGLSPDPDAHRLIATDGINPSRDQSTVSQSRYKASRSPQVLHTPAGQTRPLKSGHPVSACGQPPPGCISPVECDPWTIQGRFPAHQDSLPGGTSSRVSMSWVEKVPTRPAGGGNCPWALSAGLRGPKGAGL